MDRALGTGDHVRFGVFELDRSRGELRRRGRLVNLQDKPLLVLARLTETPGQLVTREELRELLWPGHSHGSFDTGITTAVNKVRQALGDSASTPRYIETVPRRGYRFIASIDSGKDFGRVSRKALWAAAAVLAITAMALWPTSAARDDGASPSAPLALTAHIGYEVDPAVAPGGDHVAFAWTGADGDAFDIYVRPTSPDGASRLLVGGPGARRSPLWSPDGAEVAFIGISPEDLSQLSLFVIPSRGGAPRKITEGLFLPHKGSWSPDGKWIAWGEYLECDSPAGIVLISVESGERRTLTVGPGHVTGVGECINIARQGSPLGWYLTPRAGDREPEFARDGRSLVFVRGVPFAEALYRLDLDDELRPRGEPYRITPKEFDHRRPLGPVWSPDGADVIFHANDDDGRPRLWRVSAKGGVSERLPFGEGARQPAIDPLSARMVYVRQEWGSNIWRADLDEVGSGRALSKLHSSTYKDFQPDYSPDGQRVAFTSNRSGALEIWVGDSGGGKAERVTSMGRGVTSRPRWSPDGRFIAFHSNAEEGPFQVYVLNVASGEVRRRTFRSEISWAWAPVWSPDGRWIYYTSQDAELLGIRRFSVEGETDEPVEIDRPGPMSPQVSPDGRWLYYTQGHWDTELWRMPIGGGPSERLLQSVVGPNFVVFDDGVYFVPQEESQERPFGLHFLDFSTEDTRRLLSLETRNIFKGLSVSPNRSSVLFSTEEALGRDLMLVDHFR